MWVSDIKRGQDLAEFILDLVVVEVTDAWW